MEKEKYFENMGQDVSKYNNILDVLNASKLNFKVKSHDLFLFDGTVIDGKYANVRTDNKQVLGIVGNHYTIINNIDGFEFIDDLKSYGFKYEYAGEFNNGNGSFVIGRFDNFFIEKDEFYSYILFTNTFDGTGTIKALFTPVRVKCNSVVLLAENKADFIVSVKHSKQAKDKEIVTHKIKENYDKLIESMKIKIKKLLEKEVDKNYINNLTDFMFEDLISKGTNILMQRVNEAKEYLFSTFEKLDLENTTYKMLLTVSNYESHRKPLRDTNNIQIYFDRILFGMYELNRAYSKIIKDFKLK